MELMIGIIVALILYFLGKVLLPEEDQRHPIVPEPWNRLAGWEGYREEE